MAENPSREHHHRRSLPHAAYSGNGDPTHRRIPSTAFDFVMEVDDGA